MSYNHYLPQKVDLTPKRHHGFQFVLFILGWLLPPLGELLRNMLLRRGLCCRRTVGWTVGLLSRRRLPRATSRLSPTRLRGALSDHAKFSC